MWWVYCACLSSNTLRYIFNLFVQGNMSLRHGASIAASAAMFATLFGAKQSVTCLFLRHN
jgi:hypothetical protein